MRLENYGKGTIRKSEGNRRESKRRKKKIRGRRRERKSRKKKIRRRKRGNKEEGKDKQEVRIK